MNKKLLALALCAFLNVSVWASESDDELADIDNKENFILNNTIHYAEIEPDSLCIKPAGFIYFRYHNIPMQKNNEPIAKFALIGVNPDFKDALCELAYSDDLKTLIHLQSKIDIVNQHGFNILGWLHTQYPKNMPLTNSENK